MSTFNADNSRARQLLSLRKKALKANPAKDSKVCRAHPVSRVTMVLMVNRVLLAVPAHLARMARVDLKVSAVCLVRPEKLLK